MEDSLDTIQSSRDFRRSRQPRRGAEFQRDAITNNVATKLLQYLNADAKGDTEWTNASEIPTEAEVGWIEDGKLVTKPIDIPSAKMQGGYSSKEQYLSTQYRLMRADGVLPLAKSVDGFRNTRSAAESTQYRVYEEVFFTTTMVTRDGIALKLEFSATAIGKIVQWSKSKRLRTGSLVALTPASDYFKTKCVPVVVASRALEDLEVQAPKKPAIWVYVGDAAQIDIDPQQKWIMIECVQGYWEAYRHTLQALQKVQKEKFPMAEHLVDVKPEVGAPDYRINDSVMDFSSLTNDDENPLVVDVLDWQEVQDPDEPRRELKHVLTQLDGSQIQALKQILTKKLAIVQGPPGTGKTFTSVAAIQVLLKNMAQDDPPLIIAAQTNHAIDQILRHCAKFEKNFIRIGGYTTDHDVIAPRTLGNLKTKSIIQRRHHLKMASGMRKTIAAELETVLEPLLSTEPISADVFHKEGLLSDAQKLTINGLVSHWSAETGASKMGLWCEKHLEMVVNIDKIDPTIQPDEEEYEDLDEEELEAEERDDDKYERLRGPFYELFPGFKDSSQTANIDDKKIVSLLAKHHDMLKVPVAFRPAIYEYLRRKLTEKITSRVRSLAEKCEHAARIAKIGRWENDHEVLRLAKIIGLTTTGLSKYRGLLSTLNPKIVLIEEAAETLEPYTAAAVFDTLEHLILVGDHQQLRANVNLNDLEGAPVNFDVSMFERLVKNNVEFARLTVQRRMRPEIRKLIKHIYPDLTDHRSVLELEGISGLDGVNLHFFHHAYGESMDESKSKKNDFEAKMIVEFTKYLVWNDVKLDKITVLTFYNGQRKLIMDLFRRHPLFKTYRIKVYTVDSYQGEENDVILLSLVRNNKHGNIGFLESINRACVALSRARRALFIFGNAKILAGNDEWETIIRDLHQREAIRAFLPLYCPIHEVDTDAREPSDLQPLHGGCDTDCNGTLPCGHSCPLKCHPARPCQIEDCQEGCREREQGANTLTSVEVTSLKTALQAITV